jgi:hypothetical protein
MPEQRLLHYKMEHLLGLGDFEAPRLALHDPISFIILHDAREARRGWPDHTAYEPRHFTQFIVRRA